MKITVTFDGLDIGDVQKVWLINPKNVANFAGYCTGNVVILRRMSGGPGLRKSQEGTVEITRNGRTWIVHNARVEDVRPAIGRDGALNLPFPDPGLDLASMARSEYVVFISMSARTMGYADGVHET